MSTPRDGAVVWILQVAAAATFAGYSWLCFTDKTPYHVIFWNENLLSTLISKLMGMSWDAYVTSPAAGQLRGIVSYSIGIYMAICVAAALGIRQFPRTAKILLPFGALQLFVLAVLYGLDKHFFLVQFSEYALQWSVPLFLLAAHERNSDESALQARFFLLLRFAAAATFAAHGLYALNFVPRPGQFTDMTISVLKLQEPDAIRFLLLAGVLDWVAAVLIMLPRRSFQQVAIGYMLLWGFLTALARWAAHVHFSLPWWPNALWEWTPEVLVRFPHFLAPLALWYYVPRE